VTDIHWATARNGRFNSVGDWGGGVVPGASDEAILDAAGGRFIVASDGARTVAGVQLAANAILEVNRGTFTAVDGTGGGQNAGTISIGDGASLAVGGTVDNAGVIALNSDGDASRLVILSDTTLTGDGQVTLTGEGANSILAAKGENVTLVNEDNTISGGGVIDTRSGGGKLTLNNRPFGVIADVKITASSGTGKLVNAGLLEAVNDGFDGGFLLVSNMVVSGGGGTLFAGAGSYVELTNTFVSGQALKTAPQGRIDLESGTTTLAGVVRNAGSIELETSAGILVNGAASLAGGGFLDLYGQVGANSSATLTNIDDIILGSGDVGDANLAWVNAAGGVIEAANSSGLTIEQGAGAFVNAGGIGGSVGYVKINGAVDNSGFLGTPDGDVAVTGAVTNTGTLMFAGVQGAVDNLGLVDNSEILGPLLNSGTIESTGVVVEVEGAVTGDGAAIIDGGGLDFGSSFDGNVKFTHTGGQLELAQSQAYTGQISGFSAKGGSLFYLDDIAFIDAGEATYSGTTSSGVLTVTDGTHTAHITLIGDYTAATFTASADFNGGTEVIASTPKAGSMIAASAAHFTAAMAMMTGNHEAAAGPFHAGVVSNLHPPMLATPRVMAA
jgi:hypothetical protein